MARVAYDENVFFVSTDYWDNVRAKSAPDRKWNPSDKVWELPTNMPNCRYIKENFTDEEIEAEAMGAIIDLEAERVRIKKEPFPTWYKFKGEPMVNQAEALNRAYSKNEYALFHEMGTGKTFTAINLACAWAMNNDINAVLVICPTPIKLIWDREFNQWGTIPTNMFVLKSGMNHHAADFIASTTDTGLKVMVVGIEALSQGKAYEIAMDFLVSHRAMMVVDESSRIKNYKATRTERVITLGGLAVKRLIMTGSPITQGMHDLFTQLKFLNWEILGQKSFFSFRNRYCEMGGFEGKAIVGYRNVNELMTLTKEYVHVITKDEVLDLQPKVFQVREVELTPHQKRAIVDLKEQMFTESDGTQLEVQTVLERLTRYQQIIGGNFPFNDRTDSKSKFGTMPIKGKNPKLQELKELIPETSGKMIIWARFVPEITAIVKSLAVDYGADSIAEFHGGLTDDEKIENDRKFREDDNVRFMVSNQSVGGMGQTWVVATSVVYYSNSFSYEDRVQSEDRAHRKGQENKVTYIDLIANHDADRMIHTALKNKQSMAQYVSNELSG